MNSQTHRRWRVARGSRSIVRGPWPAVHGRRMEVSCRAARSCGARRSSWGFTLVELLVTITIIGILAGMVLGVLRSARETARESATRATIVKLNNIIMDRYESYLTRRVPVNLQTTASGGTMTAFAKAQDRLYAIRDLMRMEMPDRYYDVKDSPITLPNSGRSLSQPILTKLYDNRISNAGSSNGNEDLSAELLYMIVSIGSPETMDQFHASEIGDYDGNGLPEFLDGWGRPISFLRWAPAFSSVCTDKDSSGNPEYIASVANASSIQSANPRSSHDPFDPRNTDDTAFQLFPLIYSAGPDGKLGLRKNASQDSADGYHFAKDSTNVNESGKTENMFTNDKFQAIGEPLADPDIVGSSNTDYLDNITNHQLAQ